MDRAGLRSYGEISPKLAEEVITVRRRAEADNPPVNSRIAFVLLPLAASCCRCWNEPYSNEVNRLATCREAAGVAASCRELWREKGKKRAKW